MSTVTFALTADFDRDGDFDSDLTGYVENPGSGLSISRGAAQDGTPRASQCTIALSNRSGAFTPDNAASPFAGQCTTGVPVRLTATHLGSSYTLWTGYARRWSSAFKAGQVPLTGLQCGDLLDYLRDSDPVNVTASTSRDTDGAISAIATALGLTADDLDLDDGRQNLPMHFARNQTALEAMVQAAASEMGGNLWVTAGGKLRFESRTNRLGTSALRRKIMKLTPVSYWRMSALSGTAETDLGSAAVNGVYTNTPDLKQPSLEAAGGDWAVNFKSASSEYMAVAANAAHAISTTNSLSMVALIKPATLAADMTIWNKAANLEYWWYVATNGTLVFIIYDSGGIARTTLTSSAGAIVAGQTYTVGVSAYSTGTHVGATMYINGLAVTGTSFAAGVYANSGFGGGVGFFHPFAPSVFFNGSIDEFAIFGTGLTDEDMFDLHQAARGNAWGDGTSIVPNAVEIDLDFERYTTTVSAKATKFLTGQADTPIFEFSENMFTKPTATSMALTAGQLWERTFDAASVYVALTTPAAVSDYLANTAANGTGTDKTSALTVTVTDLGGGRFNLKLKNTDAGTIYVTFFRLRGQPVEFFADQPNASFTLTVPGQKAGKSENFNIPFAGDSDQRLRDFAQQELRVGRYAYPMYRLSFTTRNDTEKTALLALELGDLIQYTQATMAGVGGSTVPVSINDFFYVDGINITIPPDWAGQAFSATVSLIPSYVFRNLEAIEFDTFDRADATGDLGTAFSDAVWADDGNFNIVSNKARANSNGLLFPNLDLGAGVFDMVTELSISNLLADADANAGIAYRLTDTSNAYLAYLNRTSSLVVLAKMVAGVITGLSSVAWTPTDTAEMRVVAQGQRHRVYVDGKKVIDTTDSAISSGTKYGIVVVNASGTVLFDNVYGQAA